MSTKHAVHSLSNTSEKRLTPNGLHSGMDITIQNLGSGNVFIGGKGVTTTNFGAKIPANGAFSVELNGSDAIFAISDVNENQISVLMFSLEK